MATEMRSFKEDVLDKSRSTPVLVDFWAPWCGPCRVLGPTLEKVAAEQPDRFALVKINTDEHPDLSMQYGIRGIPAVKLFVNGTVANEFTGALPEHAFRAWLDEAIPSESQARFSDARELFIAGNHSGARKILDEILAGDPEHVEARVLIAAISVWDDPDAATRALAELDIADPGLSQLAESVSQVANSLSSSALPEGAGKELFRTTLSKLSAGEFDEAMATLIQVLTIDRYYDDDHPRKLGVAVFTLLGPEHPVTRKHRRMFDMVLY